MKYLLTILLLLVANDSCSHGRWIFPSHSILSGENPEIVTFDFSISNDIFHPDNGYGGIPSEQLGLLFASDENTSFSDLKIDQRNRWSKLKVTRPDGSIHSSTPIIDFGRKSVASYKFQQDGTYQVEVDHKPIYYVTFQNQFNKRSRMFGKLTEVKGKLPEGASNIVATRLSNRVKTYVSRNKTSSSTLMPANNGLDIVFGTHPNEFFEGEETSIQLFLHGRPVTSGAAIKITPSGTRYRNQRESLVMKTDSSGQSTISWKNSGLLLIEVELANSETQDDYSQDKYALSVTVEVSQQ